VPDVAAGAAPAILHLEQVGEVALDDQLHVERRGLRAVVADGDVLAHALGDEAVALDHERRVGVAVAGRAAADEGGLEGLGADDRQGVGRHAVHEQTPGRHDPRVPHEQPVPRARVDVAVQAGHAEGRALDERHRRARHRRDGARHRRLGRGAGRRGLEGARRRVVRVAPPVEAGVVPGRGAVEGLRRRHLHLRRTASGRRGALHSRAI
jgi:hypothetical protein